MRVRNRLDLLNDLGKFMAAFGWVVAGLSILIGIVSIATLAQGVGRQSAVVLGFLVIFLGSVSGIVMAAMGQVMQFLVLKERGAIVPETNSAQETDGSQYPEPIGS